MKAKAEKAPAVTRSTAKAPVRTLRAEIAAQTRLLQRTPVPLGRPRTADVTQVILRSVGKIDVPALRPAGERNALAARFAHAAEKNAWDPLGEDDWEDVWQVLWEGEPPTVAISRFQMRYRRRLEASASSRPFKRLIHTYLHEFETGPEGHDWAGKLLRKIILQQKFPDLEFWREQDFKYEIFSVELGPKRLAQAIFQGGNELPPLAFLAECGLTGSLAVQGLARAAYRWALDRVGQALSLPSDQEEKPKARSTALPAPALAAFVEWTLSGPGGTLLYPELWMELYDAALAPWHGVENGPEAPAPIRRLMSEFFKEHTLPEPRAGEGTNGG